MSEREEFRPSDVTSDVECHREEVLDLAVGSYAELHDQKDALWISWRRAIETKMTQMGMLTIRRGQWC